VLFGAAREAVRNAARHGRAGDDARPLHLSVTVAQRDGMEIVVEDDGVGLTTPSPSEGSGHGLALHGTTLAVIGGTLGIESVPGRSTRVVLTAPTAEAE
jgi:signal transduction histidine kinase